MKVAASLAAAFLLWAEAAEARTRPHYGGTMQVTVDSDPFEAPNGLALRFIFDGLTRNGGEGVEPALAVRWASENNDHRWQFWLRPGVAFHDESPLSALAVVNSLQGSCRLTACPWTALRVVGQSVVFTGDSPMPNLPGILTRPEFLIRQQVDGAATAVGTGPFRVQTVPVEAGRTAGLRLEANDECWRGRPFADAVEFQLRRTNREQWTELAVGKTDLIEISAGEIRAARQEQMRLAQSSSVTLLVLEVNNPGLGPQLRGSIALAVDRAALQQVIFQKQAEITASLLPASLSGYSFLFRTERDLPGALAQRGGLTTPALTLAADSSAAMQLAAQRIALNLHDAGFAVKVVAAIPGLHVTQRADLVLRELPVAGGSPALTLEWMLHGLGLNAPIVPAEPTVAFRAEREFLEEHNVVPLLFLPRAWASSSRVRDLRLDSDGLPDLANASLADSAAAATERLP